MYGNEFLRGDENVIATLQLKGGKGGFGSMLRAIGKLKFQLSSSTNFFSGSLVFKLFNYLKCLLFLCFLLKSECYTKF